MIRSALRLRRSHSAWNRWWVVVVALVTLHARSAESQSFDPNSWVTDGAVRTYAVAGDKVYLGGVFTRIGPAMGHGVALERSTGLAGPFFPKINGAPPLAGVNVAVPDGAGGWYIGGNFTTVGGQPRLNIARILSNNNVSTWNPSANGEVTAIFVSGTTIYVGGDFSNIGGQPRNRIAAIDATTGTASTWNPNGNGTVYTIGVSGTTVYAGGSFLNIGGQPRNRIAALSASTGLATTWNPNSSGTVEGLIVSAATVFVCGNFLTIGGQTRNHLAALATATGAANNFNPSPNNPVKAIHLIGGTLYTTGFFTNAGGQPRSRIAAFNSGGTGMALPWNPGLGGTGYSLTSIGDSLFVGGDFLAAAGQSRSYVAAISLASGTALSWNPNPNGAVRALAIGGSRIFVGGLLTSFGGANRRNAAAVDLDSKTVTPWDPDPTLFVNALVAHGDRVYAGGEFTFIGGEERSYIAALDTSTGLALPWDPDADGHVFCIAVGDSSVYIGGDFSFVGAQQRDKLAAIDPGSGAPDPWNPFSDGPVRGIALRDTVAYVRGNFFNIGGQNRAGLAALSLDSAYATAWNPAPGIDQVDDLELGADGTIYIGGSFTVVGGESRHGLAALDASLGNALPTWDPDHDGVTPSVSLAVSTGGWTLYVGGVFSGIGGGSNPRLAALNVATGLARPWSPFSAPNVSVVGVSTSGVLVAGSVQGSGGYRKADLAFVRAERVMQSVTPSRGGNFGAISLSVAGEELSTAFELQLNGTSSISGTSLVASPDGTRLDAIFDLTDALPGLWDLDAYFFDETSATLPGAFLVEVLQAPLLRVSLLGPALVRSSYPASYDIVVENAGNVDAVAVPLWLAGLPASATVEPVFTVSAVPSGGGEPAWSGAPLTLTGTEGQYLSLLLPRVPPGVTVRRVNVTVPVSVVSYTLRAGITPGWAEDDSALVACLASQVVSLTQPCVGTELADLEAYLAAHPELAAVNGVGAWAREAWRCEGENTLPGALDKAEKVLDVLVAGVEQPAPLPGPCHEAAGPRWRTTLVVTVVGAVDPNEKIGPTGPVSLRQRLPYTIRFENMGTATAQRVVIVDQLDKSVLDVDKVSLGEISFGDRYLSPPPGATTFQTEMDLRPAGQNVIVQVTAELDRVTGVLVWQLRSLDPATRTLLDFQSLDGFLPPSTAPPHLQGQGSVFFTVEPRSDVQQGAIVQNRASLTFDNEPPILTPYWQNAVDIAAPPSQVLPLPVTQDSSSFTVHWEAPGAPNDLHDFTVYVKDDNGPFLPWREATTATSATFTAELGHRYWFYSVARDMSGNIEAAPLTADASTWATLAVGDAEPQLRLALEGAQPNPARGVVNAWFTLPGTGNAKLELIDVSGRRIAQRDVGALGPGRHTLTLGGDFRLAAGLYWLRLSRAREERSARVVVIR